MNDYNFSISDSWSFENDVRSGESISHNSRDYTPKFTTNQNSLERPATNRYSSSSMGSSSMYEGFNSPNREEPPPYTSPVRQRYESFENPLGGNGSTSFESGDEERVSSGNSQFGTALYDFTAAVMLR
ncbi:hypothetical protein RHMOL_Rhmol01G0103400 [Rhododendron molle]|uniref:Uncharacterized protein n=1 Tax=Rhododendron molle TaxID=49168 RepID=A0ACC0Q1C9_RHOML|nr:hypothetical protein RHMOL_Rhmol01G0103400 [Rhododendron molle]